MLVGSSCQPRQVGKVKVWVQAAGPRARSPHRHGNPALGRARVYARRRRHSCIPFSTSPQHGSWAGRDAGWATTHPMCPPTPQASPNRRAATGRRQEPLGRGPGRPEQAYLRSKKGLPPLRRRQQVDVARLRRRQHRAAKLSPRHKVVWMGRGRRRPENKVRFKHRESDGRTPHKTARREGPKGRAFRMQTPQPEPGSPGSVQLNPAPQQGGKIQALPGPQSGSASR